jgi:hypothetical protein
MSSQSMWQRARDAEASVPLISAAIAMILAALMIPGSQDFPLDDAWIHMAYAKSVRLGDGLGYNPGDWETGFSSPLWVLLLATWPLGANPVLPAKLLGLLLHGLCAWLGARIALEVGRQRASLERPLPLRSLALLSGTLVASTPTLLQGATSGMEVPLASALVLATSLAMILGVTWACALLAFLAVLARPEAIFFVTTLAALLAWFRRPSRPSSEPGTWMSPLAGALGAVCALATWSAYCLAVSGYPWPNTQYIKGTGGGIGGLAYVAEHVLPWQAWLVSLTGLWLLVRVVRGEIRERRPELSFMLVAMLVTMVAIAVTRPLHPGTLFYESRYFAIVAAIPAVALPFGIVGLGRLATLLLVLPVAVITGLQVDSLRAQQRSQEEDTHRLHTTAALHVADTLPRDAVVAVEGAGASRFFTPRTMTIVDLIGLNDRAAAHLHFDRAAKLCHFVSRAPTHMVMPVEWHPLYADTFELVPVAAFDDPIWTQVRPPRPMRIVLYEVRGVRAPWRERCGSPRAGDGRR